jgi:hypothetical protein
VCAAQHVLISILQSPMTRASNKQISSGRYPWVTAAVLFVLCFRALIPPGFMLASVDGKPEVVLCSAHANHSMHHQGPSEGGSQHGSGIDPTCPFAQSAGPTFIPTLPAPALARIAIHTPLALQSSQTRVAFGPIRLHTTRGPPNLT